MDRRQFIQFIGAGAVGLALPGVSSSAERSSTRSSSLGTNLVPGNTGANGKVVVVGGGMAGATAAKYLRLWGGTGVDVTLIERNLQYTTCIMSDLVLNGSRDIGKQVFNYNNLAQAYGVKVVNAEVTGIDAAGHKVTAGSGTPYTYDKLIVAPGIEFDVIPGLESAQAQAVVLHAWKAGPQTTALRDQIRSIPNGGVFVITIPLSPFRATAAPYDRACLVADYLLRSGKTGCKVKILDANAAIQGEPINYANAFKSLYAGVIEYFPGTLVTGIDATTLTVHTSNFGDFKANVINAIPPQRAGAIITSASLNTSANGRWAAVDVLSYESTAVDDVHILGDSAILSPQPKGGHVANAQAKVCADAITRMLRGDALDTSPVTSSTIYSPISASTASWLSAVYKYVPPASPAVLGAMAAVEAPTEASSISQKNFSRMQSWFTSLMADTFA